MRGEHLARNLPRLEVGLDPGVGVQLPHLVVAAHVVPLAAAIADHHARRNAAAAEHHRQGGGEVFAMSLLVFADEVLDGIQIGIAAAAFEAVAEESRVAELPFEVLGPRLAVVGRQSAFAVPACGQGGQARQFGRLQQLLADDLRAPLLEGHAHARLAPRVQRRLLAVDDGVRAQLEVQPAAARLVRADQPLFGEIHEQVLVGPQRRRRARRRTTPGGRPVRSPRFAAPARRRPGPRRAATSAAARARTSGHDHCPRSYCVSTAPRR